MKYTNKHGISEAIYNAIVRYASEYDKVGWRSVTTLCDSPRVKILEERHNNEIEIDVADMIWLFFGSMAHKMAEDDSGKNVIAEQRFIQKVIGKDISFKPDRLERNSGSPVTWTLRDFKFTSVYILKAAMEGKVKQEWAEQLNLYAYLLSLNGFKVTSIKLEIFGRDWRKSEQIQNASTYPKHPVLVVDVPIWNAEKQQEFLEERIKLYESVENLPDNELPKCSLEERWASQDRYAVVKKTSAISKSSGWRKALPKASYFATRSEAQAFIDEKRKVKIKTKKKPDPEKMQKLIDEANKVADQLEIEFRRGESKRCEQYCPVQQFCNQYKSEINPPF